MTIRTLAALLASLAILAPATASLTQDASNHLVTYQFDAETYHDAPDVCLAADAQFAVAVGPPTDGMLVPGDDFADHFVLDVPAGLVGSRLEVRVSEAAASPNADLMVLAPGCAGDVFTAPNIPFPLPAPPLPASGEAQLTPGNLATAGWDCSGTWEFRLKQLDGTASPQDIYVAWTDGSQGPISRSHESDGNARYDVTSQSTVLPEMAWANMPASWSGVFEVKAGPCNATDAGAVFGAPPVLGDDTVTFTPVQPGLHVVQVTLGDPQAGPTSIPVSCHFCFGPTTEVVALQASYHVSVRQV